MSDSIFSACSDAGGAALAEAQERRAQQRRGGVPVPVLIADPAGEAGPLRGLVLNRSAGGLGLFSPEDLTPGFRLDVCAARHEGAAAWVEVEVRYCYPVEGWWAVGCAFTRPQPADVLALFG